MPRDVQPLKIFTASRMARGHFRDPFSGRDMLVVSSKALHLLLRFWGKHANRGLHLETPGANMAPFSGAVCRANALVLKGAAGWERQW